MHVVADRYAQLLAHEPVGLALASVEPDVDVAAGAVGRHGVERGETGSLEQHQADAVRSVESRQILQSPLPVCELAFDPVRVHGPAEHQLPGRLLCGRKPAQGVVCKGQHPLRGGKTENLQPRFGGHRPGQHGMRLSAQSCRQQLQQDCVRQFRV